MGMGGFGHGSHGMGMGVGESESGVPRKVKRFMKGKKRRRKSRKKRKAEAAVNELIAAGRKDRKKAEKGKRRLVEMEMEMEEGGVVEKCVVDGRAWICVESDEMDGSVRVEYSTEDVSE